MVLDDIHKLWVNRGYDKTANLAAWNSMAKRYKAEAPKSAISYYTTEWKMEKTLDEANAWYINRLKNCMHVDVETEKAAEAYLREIAIEGKVYETISTTIATIGWRNTLETE